MQKSYHPTVFVLFYFIIIIIFPSTVSLPTSKTKQEQIRLQLCLVLHLATGFQANTVPCCLKFNICTRCFMTHASQFVADCFNIAVLNMHAYYSLHLQVMADLKKCV